ncbi:MAG: Holliday junction resolvase RecU [Candidatus Izemoplasmatales bacterium]|jgi:recombination protein U
MVNYPIKKSVTNQIKRSQANRGMDLEDAINQTNQFYASNDIAYIYKKPIPIQIVKVDYERRSAAKISEAYYKVPSTTDYNGIYRGRYIDFEAKETKTKTAFPLKNLHEHQIKHLDNVRRHGGISFLIVHFSLIGRTFLLDSERVLIYSNDTKGRKSIPLTEFEKNGIEISEGYLKRLDYLKAVDSFYSINEKRTPAE